MIRIEKTERNGRVVWRLYGPLTGTDGEYFAQELAAFFRDHPGQAIDVDLRGVPFMNHGALAALEELKGRVCVTACNGFLKRLLDAEGLGSLLEGASA